MSDQEHTDSNEDQVDAPVQAPGWRAIDLALSARYPGQTPHQFTSQHPYELDRPSPLPAITVWEAPAGPDHPAAWHFVSYGLSELFEKSSPDPEISGFGFELSLLLEKSVGEDAPPMWALQLLQGLARNILGQRQGLDSGHCIDLGQGADPQQSSGLRGWICIPDPDLGKIQTPFGSLLFLRLVGVYPEELELLQGMELKSKVGAMAELSPRAITQTNRASWLNDEEKQKVFRRHRVGLKLD